MQAEQQSERAAFEVEYQLMFPVSSTVQGKFEQNGIGGYEDFQVNNAWRFWQARAALAHPSPQGWQDIETLPVEDFEYAPGVRAKWSKGWLLLGRYDAHGWVEWVGTLEADMWLERDSNRCCGDSEKPTHWTPLPPPPEQGSSNV